MAWAATKTSLTATNWSTAATWDPVGVPGQDDYVTMAHNVYIDTDALAAGIYINGGKPQALPGCSLTIKDAAGTHSFGNHIEISDNAASGFNNTATKASPFVIKSASATPTYPIKMIIKKKATPDARVFDFDYCELRNFASTIGNETNYLFFNTGDVTNDGVLLQPAPIHRDQKIDLVYCEGRDYGRVYPEGGHAGVLEISGMVPWNGYAWQTLADMRDARDRVSYIGQYNTIPKGIIESLRFGTRDGPYVPFTITLVEDR